MCDNTNADLLLRLPVNDRRMISFILLLFCMSIVSVMRKETRQREEERSERFCILYKQEQAQFSSVIRSSLLQIEINASVT